ncbi:MAG TPA: ribosome small subunit-dependent GTPase A [Ignavibacteria bacterium]|nr:ribosome small subunit-dependent GTPase A [Ignavibacteria bacterium]
MNLFDLGYSDELEKFRIENNLESFSSARVISEHKERYVVKTAEGEYDAEITGNLRYSAESREDFPAVGDWVSVNVCGEDFAIINSILPRKTLIKRQAPGTKSDIQIIAANVDYAFLVQAVDRDFSVNRLERYLTICYDSKVSPLILFSKIDLTDETHIGEIINSVKTREPGVPVIMFSNETGKGLSEINSIIEKGKTYCLLGSSGVGKSTLLNNLSGKELMKTAAISESIDRGRHVTSHRELIILESGGILIDNPGMRELGIADAGEGLEITFDKIFRTADKCRYKDCTHVVEEGCAVIEAVEKGEIEKSYYENYLKMHKEQQHYESSAAEKKRKDKILGKVVKNYKKNHRNKY